jgi:hypothetical protein
VLCGPSSSEPIAYCGRANSDQGLFIAAQVWHIVLARIEIHSSRDQPMTRFYQPDLSTDLDSPFIRDGEDKLIRRSYWLVWMIALSSW